MAQTAALTTNCSRVDVLIGEITVRFVGNVAPQTARVVLEALHRCTAIRAIVFPIACQRVDDRLR